MAEEKKAKTPRLPHLGEALLTFAMVIVVMSIGILVFEVDAHMPMFVGVLFAAAMALYLGYDWQAVETAMFDGIYRALQAIVILSIVGILVGVWLVSGVVPTMIYYGLMILSPSIFLVATLLICSITSLATGTSWGTMSTMGIALMGVALGLGFPPGMTAGAIISGAYFGDKMSPLSDTTNLAPAMAGTDVFTHVKFMIPSTAVTYVICLVFFAVLGLGHAKAVVDISAVQILMDGLKGLFNINPILLLPPLLVIIAIAMKMPAIPGIVLGILSAALLGPIFQPDCTFGSLLDCGMNGFVSSTGVEALDDLLTAGGLESMMYSISLTILAMMFGGIMEATHQMEVVVGAIVQHIKRDFMLVGTTLLTCLASNATMPEQYISIILPGRMFAPTYKERHIAPETLSNALEGAGTVTSALIPWNTCGVYILSVLGVGVSAYLPYAMFNWLMPIVVFVMAIMGFTIRYEKGYEKR
ncbi:MAG: Na+/H+ antiporter NhaC [Thermovirgaceae bacterium]|nr:Na+/H+ antiporter NhaC [Synergistales bacterium]